MKQFTQRERDKLEVLKKAGHTQQYIAEIIGCNQSTISRELQNNSSPKQQRYNAKQHRNVQMNEGSVSMKNVFIGMTMMNYTLKSSLNSLMARVLIR
jgi:IS30 family transposase